MYKLIRNFLFLFPAEGVHYFSMNVLRLLCRFGWLRNVITGIFSDNLPFYERELYGLRFKNIVGLGAGFDKNAIYLRELEALGFGFVEIGTVTPKPQPGNERPRLFRLKKDLALINRMGFNNDGAQAVAQRLRVWKEKNKAAARRSLPLLVGGNIGKNKSTPNDEAWKDYEICFRALFDCVDYFVVNVSSPNTPGLRELQEKAALQKILSHLQAINHDPGFHAGEGPKPLFLKIAPDLNQQQIDDVIELALQTGLSGLVATNTTLSREDLRTQKQSLDQIGAGGLSGAPLKKRSTEILRYIHLKTQGRLPVIASGGIFHPADADEKLRAGASLLQVWTGFIYEGPGITRKLLRGMQA